MVYNIQNYCLFGMCPSSGILNLAEYSVECHDDDDDDDDDDVEVILLPTVSRPVRLGVLPPLEQVTRLYIYLSDNYFFYFSCRAPSLTKGRVCNLQCNDASSISSYIATDDLSACSYWGAHNQILISL
jgi:hypothetical protein